MPTSRHHSGRQAVAGHLRAVPAPRSHGHSLTSSALFCDCASFRLSCRLLCVGAGCVADTTPLPGHTADAALTDQCPCASDRASSTQAPTGHTRWSGGHAHNTFPACNHAFTAWHRGVHDTTTCLIESCSRAFSSSLSPSLVRTSMTRVSHATSSPWTLYRASRVACRGGRHGGK